jgi:hypothetical protein
MITLESTFRTSSTGTSLRNMGRKRRNKFGPTKQDNELTLPKEVGELIVTLLDLCGFFPVGAEDRSSRLQLIQSLKVLSATLQATRWKDRDNNLLNDDSSYQLFLLEERISGVRRDADAFRETIEEERSEIFGLNQELDSVIHMQKCDLRSWHIFVRSVVAKYCMQSQLEEQMTVGWLNQTLDSLYSMGDERHETDYSFQQLIRCLSRDVLMQQPLFQEGVALIRLLVLQAGDTLNHSSLTTSTVSAHYTGKTAHDVPVEADYAPADEDIVQSPTVWSAFESFLRADMMPRHPAKPNFTAVLVVGSEGSAKTHLCNEMERLALTSKSSVIGTYNERLVECAGSPRL